MKSYNIAVIGGDGTGPEVAARRQGPRRGVEEIRPQTELHPFRFRRRSLSAHRRSPARPGPSTSCANFPPSSWARSAIPTWRPAFWKRACCCELRFQLDQYINLRPVKLYPRRLPLKDKGPEDIDFVVVRENTEDLYCGVGGFLKRARPTKSPARRPSTPAAASSAASAGPSSSPANATTRRKCSRSCAKTNVLTYGHDLWGARSRRWPERVSGHQGRLQPRRRRCMWMVKNPEYYDVIVTDNMFGDIITDLGGMLQGGMGVAAGGNINPDGAPACSSRWAAAPRSTPARTSSTRSRPSAPASMMLDFLGETKAADAIENAVIKTSAKNKSLAAGKMGTAPRKSEIWSRRRCNRMPTIFIEG